MDSFDLVTVGEATVDIFLWIDDSNKHFRLNTETNELRIQSGDKALVDKAYFMTGGNAGNVAVGASRMGYKTAIVAEIGKDEFGQKIANSLSAEEVSTKYLKENISQLTSFSTILNYKGERTIFTENVEREHNFSFENISTKWLYLTSMAKKWEHAYDKTLAFVKDKQVKLAFNPGTLQIDTGIEKINEILGSCDAVFVNKEEAAKICGVELANDESLMPHLLSTLKEKGAKIAVITDGARGTHMIDSSGEVSFKEPAQIQVVEKTGAGDAFASGFLSGLLEGLSSKEALEKGSDNANAVIGSVGAQAGLLRKQ